MAVTKTHPIKSTLKAAIDYICNPEKTDGKLLVSSYGCAAETADIEFSWTRRHAIDKGTNLGRHLIQAFQPGEVTPEQAHEIGMELAKEILGGNSDSLRTFPQRLLRRLSILSYPILMRKYYGNSFSTEVQFVPLFKQQNHVKVI